MIHARIQEFSSGGGGVQVHLAYKKSSDNVYFLFYFFSPQLILQKSSGFFQRKLLFTKVRVGVGFFSRGGGGSNFLQGVQLLFPNRNPYNLWFSRGTDPLWIRQCDSAHRGLINVLLFSFSILALLRWANVASAAGLPVVVVIKY